MKNKLLFLNLVVVSVLLITGGAITYATSFTTESSTQTMSQHMRNTDREQQQTTSHMNRNTSLNDEDYRNRYFHHSNNHRSMMTNRNQSNCHNY